MAKCSKCSAAKFPCEYCECPAVSYVGPNKKSVAIINTHYEQQETKISQDIQNLTRNQDSTSDHEEIHELQEELENLQRKKEEEIKKTGRKQLTWPASTMNGDLRTIDNIKNIVQKIEQDPDILKRDPDSCKGIKGRSPFLDQPRFNIIKDFPAEYMHTVCIGAVKRMIELCFKVGDTRERQTKRKLSPPKLYNDKIRSVQTTREFSHRCRILDFGVMKASEFRNAAIFFFPIILDCIEDEFADEKKMWLHFVYMLRACVLPNNEFRKINENDVLSACSNFYRLYEKLYGRVNCTYSIHVVASHILKIKGSRPLTHKSAFKFESFFAEMRQLFHPGSVSTVKQILQNCYVKRQLKHHTCEKTTFFKPEKKAKPGVKLNPGMENNHSIYVYNENETISMYSIQEVIDNDNFLCKIQGKFKIKFPLTPKYDWSTVGVFKEGPVSDETKTVLRNEISGKVLKVNGYLITCPNNVLHEQ